MDLRASKYHDVYARSLRDPEGFWAEAAQASRDFFQKATHPETGLAPDYANFDGTPYSLEWNANARNRRSMQPSPSAPKAKRFCRNSPNARHTGV